MYLIYSVLVSIVILFVVGVFMRKTIYKEVDVLEDWKNDILNRPIPDEIGRVKSLQMSGETEEKFELWRNDWDEIVGTILPDIEEELFDIEELAGKFRFKKAKQLIVLTQKRLNGIEQNLTTMVEDIEGLVESANHNRTESGGVREQLQHLQSELLQKRGTLGPSIQAFDSRLQDLKEKIKTFDQLMNEGSYLQARTLLAEVKSQLDLTSTQAERMPKLLVQVQSTIPAELKNLRDGIEQMIQAGYHLEPFSFEPKIEALEDQVAELKKAVHTLECEMAEEQLAAITEQVEQMYDALESEVHARQHVLDSVPALRETLGAAEEQLQSLIEETSYVQLSYRITDDELSLQEKIRKRLGELSKQLQVIVDVTENEKQTYTSIDKMIRDWEVNLQQLQVEVAQGKKQLDDLREDELKAKETLSQLRRVMLDSKRELHKSNIPGLPERSVEQLHLGERKIREAGELLDLVPLEMGRVNALVGDALIIIEENQLMIKETIEKAKLTERVIQYGNRYRSKSQHVQIGLLRAEELFREYEYDEAIEVAVRAVKPYEDNIVERVSLHMIS